ncbi:hypothetical protein V6N13_142382 [Hibiscus sabdariffa]
MPVRNQVKFLKWSPPLPGFLKLNVDGVVSRFSSRGGIGGLLRDEGELCLKVCKVEADSLAKSVFYNPSGWPRTILWLQSRSSGGLIELSHLQFADELLIFSGGSEGQFRNVKKVLRVFELASGLQLNLKKSMVFGINVPLVDPLLASSLCIPVRNQMKFLKWSPPPSSFLKLNVNGDVSRFSSRGGIGGLLRDEGGKVLFESSEGYGNSQVAWMELLAMKTGIHKFLSSEWASSHRLIIEPDCKVLNNWVLGSEEPPIYSRLVLELSDLIKCNGFLCRIVPPVCNVEADSLAKSGIGLCGVLWGSWFIVIMA